MSRENKERIKFINFLKVQNKMLKHINKYSNWSQAIMPTSYKRQRN